MTASVCKFGSRYYMYNKLIDVLMDALSLNGFYCVDTILIE